MSIRRDPIYVSYEVWRALRLLAKAKQEPAVSGREIVTADQLADEMLAEVLVERYPKITEHLKQVDRMERELAKTLSRPILARPSAARQGLERPGEA